MGMRLGALCLAFVLGVLSADRLRPGGLAALAAGIAGVALLAWGWAAHRRFGPVETAAPLPRISTYTAGALLAGAALVGFCDMGLTQAAAIKAQLPRLDGRVVDIAARVTADPLRAGRAVRLFVRTSLAGHIPVREKLAVSLYGHLPNLEPGDQIFLPVKIKRLDPADGYDDYLRHKGAVARAAGAASEVRLLAKDQSPFMSVANSLRRRISRASKASLPRERSALLLGLVTGDETGVSQTTRDNFRAAGLSHLTAVSGANVAMVVAPLMLLLTAARISRRTRIAIGLAAVGLFVMVTRWEPSVMRAGAMASVSLGAFLFGRKADPRHVLGVAFIGLVAFDPLILWSVGFQLSFAASAGIVLLAPLMLKRLRVDSTAETGGHQAGPRPRRRVVFEALAVGAAAQFAVMPLLGWHFGRISLVAAPANLAAFPLVAPATVLGMGGGLIAAVSGAAAQPLIEVAGVFVWGLERIALLFGGSTHAQAELPNFATPQMIAAYLALAGAVALLAGRTRLARWPLILSAALVIAAGLVPLAHAGRPAGIRVTFFDVGQGDSALVESRSGARMLIDGGPDPAFVANKLIARGIGRIDVAIASHAHLDHIAGLGRVVERLEVRKLLDPGVDDPLVRHTFRARTPQPATEGEQITMGDLSVEFLAPSRQGRREAQESQGPADSDKEGSALNDASVVARVSYGRICALFPGDLEEPGQQALIDSSPGDLSCPLLKAPHHGSARLLPEFVRKVAPVWVAVSSGPNNFGHPAAKALEIFSRSGARVVRTDLHGDIVFEGGADGSIRLR